MTWMQTANAHAFDLADPRAEDVDFDDIATALGYQCRFNGHVPRHYSVAEHCCHVSDWLLEATSSADLALAGLLHDAHEAYVGDLSAPMKAALPPAAIAGWREVEARVDAAILKALGRQDIDLRHPLVKKVDARILLDERVALWADRRPRPWAVDHLPRLGIDVRFWPAGRAAGEWARRLRRFPRH